MSSLVGCTSRDLRVGVDAEQAGYGDDPTPRAVGAGLIAPVRVYLETWDFGDEEPAVRSYTPDEVTLSIVGGTQVNCPEGVCFVADPVDHVQLTLDTPDGQVTATRSVATSLSLAAYTPNWGEAPVTGIHLLSESFTSLSLVFVDEDTRAVSGRVDSYEATGPLVLDASGKLFAGAPGIGSLAAAGAPSIAPLEVRVASLAESAASIAQIYVDRVFASTPEGRTSLTAYTQGSVGAVLFDGFDADGMLTLPGIPLEVTGGPGVVAHPWPGGEGPCVTNSYCFLRGELPQGVDASSSYVDVRAGSAMRRLPVNVVRGSY